MSGIKRSPADAWFSKCVREAADYKCQCCGKQYDRSSTGLHCSHNFSRRHRTIRWCSDNALALCYGCHEWFGSNPYESGAWLEKKVGSGTLDVLLEKKRSKVKVSKLEEKGIAKHYKAEHEKLMERRDRGETGYLDFVSYQ